MTVLTATEPVHRLVVAISDGDLRIVAAPDGHGSVEIEGPGADDVDVDITAGTITVRLTTETGRRFGRGGLRVVVAAPAGVELDLKSASLDVHAEIDLGAVTIATASGDIRAPRIGALRAKTASGDIHVGTAASVRAAVASGDLRFERVEGDLEVSAASGDIRAGRVGGRVDVRTASGDIRIGAWTGTDLSAKTVSGDLTVTVPPGTRAHLDVKTFSGRVTMPDRPTAEAAERVERRLTFSSVSGDFDLRVG